MNDNSKLAIESIKTLNEIYSVGGLKKELDQTIETIILRAIKLSSSEN